jgi:ABC-type nickel/cobalt efflux system permease component RcnA
VALIVAFGLGGLHALTPGHNKVLTGAYLVGSRAGYRDAILIGAATAFSHTATVIVIGILALSPQGQAAVSFYLRWLGVPAGLLVAGLGFWLLMRYLGQGVHPHSHAGGHDHSHGHSHEHSHSHRAPTDRLTLGGLVGLGLVHGIVPTADALAVLLVALSVKQTFLGLLLILSYSLGIASVMSAVGMLFLTSQGLMERFTRLATLSRWGPAVAAATVSLLGLVMIVKTIGV